MTQSDPSIKVNPVATFSKILENPAWRKDLQEAAEADSVAFIKPNEQPAPIVSPSVPKSRGPR